jgi:hypothetical protein
VQKKFEKGAIAKMIVGPMASRLDVAVFGWEGYSSHKPPRGILMEPLGGCC